MDGLTPKQQQVETFITHFLHLHGYGPTLREIQEHLGCSSLNTVRSHLALLVKKGRLQRAGNTARSIRLVKPDPPMASPPSPRRPKKAAPSAPPGIPLLGSIPAGPVEEALITSDDTLALDAGLFRGELVFALRVKGDSMKNAGIFSGDYAILNSQDIVSDGQIAAVQEDGDATLKRVFRKPNGLLLRPENAALKERLVTPSEAKNVRIVGRLVGLLRIEGGRR
ncbi:repressor LexA [Prosthecobacter fusiformis]|uniref:Repressor LexA n=1 Tax=Prosthecobacter fusiformis TaxID=48464 RepID=A0A4R7RJB3_9BACT|nr:transcriptional repressor LexA [Prosthecobacter fusiformis]TDU64089.1 repressor LexA [Prosthecobacter fusiformis]